MEISYDPAKNQANIAKHGVSFEEIHEIDWSSAVISRDHRRDYGEPRFIAYVLREEKLHCLVWTPRDGKMRPISFRKANRRERKDYEEEKNT